MENVKYSKETREKVTKAVKMQLEALNAMVEAIESAVNEKGEIRFISDGEIRIVKKDIYQTDDDLPKEYCIYDELDNELSTLEENNIDTLYNIVTSI